MRKDKLSTGDDKKNEKKLIGPKDENGLTSKMAAFVREYTSGKNAGNGAKSACIAGYGEKNTGSIACYLLKLPAVSAAIDATLRAEIGSTLTVQAIKVIRTILSDDNAPLKLRADTAARVVEFSGIVDRVRIEKQRETGLAGDLAGPKRLGEMTRHELEDMVRNGAALLQAAAALPPVTLDISPTKPKEAEPNPFKVKALA